VTEDRESSRFPPAGFSRGAERGQDRAEDADRAGVVAIQHAEVIDVGCIDGAAFPVMLVKFRSVIVPAL
jgi:hypothetical protein